MSITPQLRSLMEDRKKTATPLDTRLPSQVTATFSIIDKAAPFMDEGCSATKWPPSTLLKLTYFVALSCGRPGADRDALLFILNMLDRARKLWVGGFHPNPFLADEELLRRHTSADAS